MYYNRDEFLLLSRGGRVPPRTGPPRPRPQPSAGEPWLMRLAGSALSGMLGSGPTGAERVSPRGPAAGYADRQSYLELEFAVGFAADDEPWP